jgi:hypothetical protein
MLICEICGFIILDNYGIGALVLGFGASDVVYQKSQAVGPLSVMLGDLVDAVAEDRPGL